VRKSAAKRGGARKAVVKKAAKKLPAKKIASKVTPQKAAKKRGARKTNVAFMKPLTPTGPLAAIIGSTPLPRTEVTSKIWAYIKKNKLQDSGNRRNIHPDKKLLTLFGRRGNDPGPSISRASLNKGQCWCAEQQHRPALQGFCE